MAHRKYNNPVRWGGRVVRSARGSTVNQRRRLNVQRGPRSAPSFAIRPRSTMTIRREPWSGFKFTGPRRVIKKAGLRNAAVNMKVVKKAEYPKKRKVIVSRPLRAKINKVINGREYSGFFQHTTYGYMKADNAANVQTVFEISAEGTQAELFTPNLVMNAAAVLWNGKPPRFPSVPTIADAQNFNIEETKIYIKKAWCIVTITNNSQRKLYLKLFECKAKSNQTVAYPAAAWANALAQMHNSKAAPSAPYSENPLNTTSVTLHASPKSLTQWNQWYSAEVTNVTLAPGQTYYYRLNGPTNTWMDMAKYFNSGTYQPVNKFGRYLMAVLYPDLVTMHAVPVNSNDSAARAGESSLRSGLDFEHNTYYSLLCPEKAGTVGAGTANVGLELGERHTAYSIQNDEASLAGMLPYRVDEVDPNPAEDPPDV